MNTAAHRQLIAVLFAALLLLGFGLPARADNPRPFTADTFAWLQETRAGSPFLLVLWSVHCAPCFAELAMLAELLEERPGLPLVLVSADPPAAAGEVRLVLEDYGLAELASWQFAADIPERLRYSIDPDWFGELPRSYFHYADGRRRPHSGVISRDMVREFPATGR